MDRNDFIDKIIGGIFALIAIGASITEMALGGFSVEAIVGAIKDISGTIIAVLVFIIAIKAFLPKKAKNFKVAFEQEMERELKKYAPLIQKDEQVVGRYNIASRIDAIYDNNMGKYHTLFDFDFKNKLTFSVSKTLFMGRSTEDFSEMQGRIVSDIAGKITKNYEIVADWKKTTSGFELILSRDAETVEDVESVVDVIDAILLLYVAESKK